MQIIGIDASLVCTGYSVFSDNEVIDYGKIITCADDYVDDIERLSYICDELENVIKTNHVKVVVLEDSIPARKSRSVTQLNFLKGMIIATARRYDVDIELIYPSRAKKLVTGNGKASKAVSYTHLTLPTSLRV